MGRLSGKRAVVVGAGQTPGDTIGNGRATAIRFAPPFTMTSDEIDEGLGILAGAIADARP